MPWYRTPDGQGEVHIHIGGKQHAPAPCRAPKLAGEPDTRHHGDECGRVSAKLCDGRVGQAGSCDMPLCEHHATPAGADIDYCPRHAHLAAPVLADPRRI